MFSSFYRSLLNSAKTSPKVKIIEVASLLFEICNILDSGKRMGRLRRDKYDWFRMELRCPFYRLRRKEHFEDEVKVMWWIPTFYSFVFFAKYLYKEQKS